MSYEPRELSGGEDWFALFRAYWKDKTEDNYNEYILEKKRANIQKTLDVFFGGTELIQIEHIQSAEDPDAIPLKNSVMLSFILTFYKKVFLAEMNQVLRPILIDGDFIKKENRVDFTESYNELIKVDDLINSLIRKLAPTGDYGRRFKQLQADVVAPAIRHRKMQILKDDIEVESDDIVSQTQKSIETMNAVIHGIVRPEQGDKYNTLTNITQMLGKSNRDFMDALEATANKLMMTVDLVDNILDVEDEG
jgi:hypothetical protein